MARAGVDPLIPLGYDFLTFLAATVLVVPLFKRANVSPVLGYLFVGVVLNQLGLFRSVEEIEKLGELGVLFLLFEMGLELSVDRLKALSKYAFGMGLLQMVLCTAAFTAFALPVGHGLGSMILEGLFHAPQSLVGIRRVDEAIVIGYALSLSSSAFVLQLLSERGELATRFGSATLGILLFQDIAVVPFLVLLPQVAQMSGDADGMSLLLGLGPQAVNGVGFLLALLVAGRFILKRVFETVASSNSPETFVAACLLTVTGCSVVTQSLGFSDTLGAFLAGVLLAETNFRTQVEADIRAFRGILLGLFFVTTGASINLQLLLEQWPVVFALVLGLLGIKSLLISVTGPLFGLTKAESVRTGLLMSQGGEFAFVLLSLASTLEVLPQELNKLLIIVVVISMALTPVLAELSQVLGDLWEEPAENGATGAPLKPQNDDAVVICGFGQMGQVLVNMLDSPMSLVSNPGYVAFDLDPSCVNAAQGMGFPVYYADATRPEVLHTIGVEHPKAVIVLYPEMERALFTVANYRRAFPDVPIFAHAADLWNTAALKRAGATTVVSSSTDAAINLGMSVLSNVCGSSERDVVYLGNLIGRSLEKRVAGLEQAMGKLEDKRSLPANEISDMSNELKTLYEQDVSSLDGEVTARGHSSAGAQLSTTSQDSPKRSTVDELIEILGGTPPTSLNASSYQDLGYVCGDDSNSPSECIDLTIRPTSGRTKPI
eukprot:jgi/Tetstr1/434283/TSEL_023390.t1